MLLLFLYSIVGIMGALDEEIKYIKKYTEIIDSAVFADRKFYLGKIDTISVVVVKSGIGKVNAALTTQLLIDKYNPKYIIFTGVAGGINPEIKLFDIIVAEKVAYHDFGKIEGDSFAFWDSIQYFYPDSNLINIAKKVAHAKIGTIVTGDQFIASETKRKWLYDKFKADCVEMEGAAFAHVCEANNVPFIIIRCVSDLAGEEATIDFEKFCEEAAKKNSAIVINIIKYGVDRKNKK